MDAVPWSADELYNGGEVAAEQTQNLKTFCKHRDTKNIYKAHYAMFMILPGHP